ncbi:MAG: peptidase [Myxococcales bacterium]|nr:peptidase [Myxococcales bacterium]
MVENPEAAARISEELLDSVLSMGATQADVIIRVSDRLAVSVRKGEHELVDKARSSGLGLRVIVDGHQASASTSDLDAGRLKTFGRRILDMAQAAAPDGDVGLPAAEEYDDDAESVELYDASLENLETQDLVELASTAEQAAFDEDARIQNSEGAKSELLRGFSVYACSRGVTRVRRGSRLGLSCEVLAQSPGSDALERDQWWAARRSMKDFPGAESIGKKAAVRAVSRLNSILPATGRYPVVLSPEAAGQLLRSLSEAINGYSVLRKATFLGDARGTQIMSSAMQLVDNPLIDNAPSSRTFDGEGLHTRPVVLVRDGVLENFILDSYVARRLGLDTNRQAVRGLGSPPRAGASNLHLGKGTATPRELVNTLQRGVYVSSFMGFGVNLVTGDFSKGARGFLIEGGDLGAPIHEFTVAGNLREMLLGIQGVGNDLDPYRGVSSPTLMLGEMAVAGGGTSA